MRCLENKTFDDLKTGQSASLTRTLTPQDIKMFGMASRSMGPVHLDETYIQSKPFNRIISHGMWLEALFSSLLGLELPGPGTTYVKQSLSFLNPIAAGETVTAKAIVTAKNKERKEVTLALTCTDSKGRKVAEGEMVVKPAESKVCWEMQHLPDVDMADSSRHYELWLRDKIKKLKPLLTAVVHPADIYSLGGAVEAAEEGIIVPILIGPKDKILAAAKEAKLDISKYTLLPTKHSHEAAEKAVEMARSGKVEALMKGKLHTDELMEACMRKETGLRTGRRMSHVFLLDVPSYPKPLLLTDAAINIAPTLMEKKDIVQNAVDLFHALGMGVPKVAILAAVETVNEKMPATLDATALCKMAERGQITDCQIDGPLAFDNAVSLEAATIKGIHSEVAGRADILVAPDIESGNMLYKQLRYFSGVQGAGIVLGAKVPIILTSRASDAKNRIASCALGLVYARHKAASLLPLAAVPKRKKRA